MLSFSAFGQKKQCLADFKMHYDDAEFEEAVAVAKNCPAVKASETTHYHFVRSLMFRKEYELARDEFRLLNSKYGQKIEYTNGLGAAFYQLFEYDSAMYYYNRSVEIDPTHQFSYYNRGMLHYEMDNFTKAGSDVEKHLDRYPKDADAWALLADVYREDPELGNAIESYKKAIDLDPQNENAWFGISEAYFNEKDYEKALEASLELVKIDGDDPVNLTQLGDVYYFMDNEHYEEAIKWYKKSIKYDGKDAYTYSQLASSYDYSGDYKQAVPFFLKALEIEENIDDRLDLANCYVELGMLENAMEEVDKAIKLDPNDPYVHTVKGYIYMDNDKYKSAINCFEEAAKIDPDDPHNYMQIAYCYYHTQDYEAAIEYNTIAIELDPTKDWRFADRGDSYFEMGDYESAIKDYQKAVELNPSNGEAYYMHGLCLFEKKAGNYCDYMKMAAARGSRQAEQFVKDMCK